jgi:hypothetical protein
MITEIPNSAPYRPAIGAPMPTPSSAPRKAPWERIKDLASSITAVSAAAALVLTVAWYVAKPAIDSQYCTVAHAAKVESRIEAHEVAQNGEARALAAQLASMARRLGTIELHLCLLVAGKSSAEQAKCLQLRGTP